METHYKLFPAVISTALAITVLVAGCSILRRTNAAVNAPDICLSSTNALQSGNVEKSVNSLKENKAVPASSADVRPQAGGVSEADPSCMDGAVFIGDSVTLKLQKYVEVKRRKNKLFFGKAKFLAAGSMGSGNALKPLGEKSIHPYYNGEKALLEDSAAKIGARKAYIMLGMNDIAVYGVDGAADNLEKLSKRILNKNPGIKIYIESVTPMLKNKQKRTLNNANIEIYNGKVKEICKKQSWYYIDVASVMRGNDGSLIPEYCSDPDDLGIHFTDKACGVWIHYILANVPAEERQ